MDYKETQIENKKILRQQFMLLAELSKNKRCSAEDLKIYSSAMCEIFKLLNC